MNFKVFAMIINVASICFGHSNASNRTDAENLLKYVFNGYNREVQPDYNRTIDVSLSFLLFTLVEFDEVTGVLSTVSGISLNWTDLRLNWDPMDYSGLEYIRIPSTKIWYPEIVCLTQADKLERIGGETFGGIIYNHGSVVRILCSLLKTSCAVDMTYFPFDEQVCRLQFSTWGYSSHEIHLTENGLSSEFLKESPRWTIVGSEIFDEKLGMSADSVVVEITIKRRPQHFVVTTLIPIVMLLFLNPFVFVLPVESGERTSYTVTIFLSQVVFMTLVGQNIPNSANPMPRLSYFVLIAMAFSILQTLTTIALMVLTFTDSHRNAPKLLLKIAHLSFDGCSNVKSNRKVSTVEEINENETVPEREGSFHDKNDEYITLEKTAEVLSRLVFVVSLSIVVIIITTLVIAMKV